MLELPLGLGTSGVFVLAAGGASGSLGFFNDYPTPAERFYPESTIRSYFQITKRSQYFVIDLQKTLSYTYI